MAPKEKAKELANKFVFKSILDMDDKELKLARIIAKQCALICVDEKIYLLNDMATYWDLKNGDWYDEKLNELKKIKSEIEKL